MRLQWIDSRLEFDEDLGVETLRCDPKQIWIPDIYFDNEV